MKTVTRTGTTSFRTAEYGSVKDRKKGWKAVTLEMDDIPRPEAEFIHKADPFHSVIVSGILRTRVFSPESLQGKQNDSIHHVVSYNDMYIIIHTVQHILFKASPL